MFNFGIDFGNYPHKKLKIENKIARDWPKLWYRKIRLSKILLFKQKLLKELSHIYLKIFCPWFWATNAGSQNDISATLIDNEISDFLKRKMDYYPRHF